MRGDSLKCSCFCKSCFSSFLQQLTLSPLVEYYTVEVVHMLMPKTVRVRGNNSCNINSIQPSTALLLRKVQTNLHTAGVF